MLSRKFLVLMSARDKTAPTLSGPAATATGSTTAALSVSTNEGRGTLYWVVTTSATPPTALQVEAGQNDGGTAAVASGNQAVSATGAQAASATGLTAATVYYAYFMHKDAAGNRSTVSSASNITTFQTETQTLINAITTPPSVTRAGQINTLIAALKTANVWASLDFLYVMAAADSQAARLNWVNPGTWTLAPAGGPTFTADRGYTGDGSTTGLSIGVALSTMAKFTLNSASVGAWVQQSTTADENSAIFGTASSIAAFLNPRLTSQINTRFNDATTVNTNNTTVVGLFSMDRAISTQYDVYLNGASLATKVVTTTSVSTVAFQFLRAATFTTRRLSAGYGGASLGSAGQTALYNALAAYHTAIGA